MDSKEMAFLVMLMLKQEIKNKISQTENSIKILSKKKQFEIAFNELR